MNGIQAAYQLVNGKMVSKNGKVYQIRRGVILRGIIAAESQYRHYGMTNEEIAEFLASDGFELYTEKLVIEAGKFYKTREGKKVVIYAVGCGKHSAIHGAIYDADGSCEVYEWSHDGGVCLPEESYTDIIGLWDGK